jgi:hypothetical protein
VGDVVLVAGIGLLLHSACGSRLSRRHHDGREAERVAALPLALALALAATDTASPRTACPAHGMSQSRPGRRSRSVPGSPL